MTGTDPSQFVDFLRAVSASTKRVGTQTVRGVQTTHYRALIDLDRYPRLVPAAQRATARRTVSTLESAVGRHTMPIDAWVDGRSLVRRLAMTLSECLSGAHLRFGMTMDLFGYGPQPKPQLTSSGEVYDLTPLLTASLSKIKLGCSTG